MKRYNIYEIFKKALGEDQAKTVITYLESADNKAIDTAVAAKTESLATKEQLSDIKEYLSVQIANTRADMIK